MGPIRAPACASSPSYESQVDYPSLMSPSSEQARSDNEPPKDVAMEDKREVDDVVAYISDEYIVEDEEAQEQDILEEVLEVLEEIWSEDEAVKETEFTEVEGVDGDDVVADINLECIVESVQSAVEEKYEECFKVEGTPGNGEEMAIATELLSPLTVDCITHPKDNMIKIIDEETAEIKYLAEQLVLSNDKVGPEALAKSQHDLTEQFDCSKEENDKLKLAMLDLVASNEENAQVISMLGEALAEKNVMIEKMTEDIVQCRAKYDDIYLMNAHLMRARTNEDAVLTEQLQLSNAKNEELQAEVQSLVANNKAAQLFKNKNDRLEVELQTLVTKNKENVKQISLLEDELVATKTVMAESMVELNTKNTSLEKKSVQIAELTEQLAVSSAKNIELEAELSSSVAANKEITQRMTVLEDDFALKMTLINEMNVSLTEKSAQIADISEAFSSKKIELEAELSSSVTANKEITQQMTVLEDDLALKMTLIDEMNVSLTEKSAQIADISEAFSSKKIELEAELSSSVTANKEITQRMTVLEDNLTLKMTLIDEMNVSLTEKLAQIADISEQLANSTAENDEFKDKIHELVSSKREYVNKISVLTDEVTAKQVTIDALNAEIKGLNSTCMKMATANVSLDENFTLLQAEWDVLKTTVQDIESKNKENDTEIEKLTLSLKNANTSNVALQLQVEEVRAANGKFIQMSKKSKKTISELQVALKTMTKCFNDERSNSDKLRQEINLFKNRSLSSSHSTEKLLREMSEQKRTIDNLNKSLDEAMAEVSNKEKMLDEKTAEIQAYVGDATKTIDNLAKSLDEATAEMAIKDKLLEEKTNEIQNRFDLSAQFNAADCGVGGVGGGMGNFWQTMYGSN